MNSTSIHQSLFFLAICLSLAGCAGTKVLEVDANRFPVPLMSQNAVSLGVLLDDDIRSFVHKETIEKKGSWEVVLGPVQQTLFTNLSTGVFESFEFVNTTSAPHLDGVLKPTIKEVQFSLPSQTRSNYYEVWIRYDFELFDREGGQVGQWSLPAYGKANKNNFGSKSVGLQEAALAACRDAMAFFSINFAKEPAVYKWLTAGKPLMPKAPPQEAEEDAQEDAESEPTSTTPTTGTTT
ncbi:MAG: hypothetical protein AAF541_18735 [Pseudomonadota bacterium]